MELSAQIRHIPPQINQCRDAASFLDSPDHGDITTVNQICASAQRSPYDISQPSLNPYPSSLYLEYLNTAPLQSAIGVALTQTSYSAAPAFHNTGDYERGGHIADLSALLAKGVRVTLIYGDRDCVCNWLGGEAVSFALAAATNLAQNYSAMFDSAGYTPIVSNTTYVGGVVRQAANLSFSRIYDAGYLVPEYQPETIFTLFTRSILGTDLSSGESVGMGVVGNDTFISQGDANATTTNSALPQAQRTCFVRAVGETCDDDAREMLRNVQGVVINGALYDDTSLVEDQAAYVVGNDGLCC